MISEMIIHDLIQLFILFILIFSLGFYFQRNRKDLEWIEKLKQTESIFWLLIGWVILGFLTTFDYNQQWGDVIRYEPVFSIQNMSYSSVTLILLFIGYFIPNLKIRTVILATEIIFWGYKLFFIKGGYEVGFGGGAATSILLFDIISLTLRFVLIKRILSLKFNSLYIFIPVLIIMIIRVIC